MKPEICESCGAREFIQQPDAYVCAYCDTKYPIKQEVAVQPVRYAQPVTPQPRPVTQKARQAKDKWIAFVLCLLVGCYGVHKFYEGRILMGLLYLFTGGLFGIGWLVDCIVLLCKPNPYYV